MPPTHLPRGHAGSEAYVPIVPMLCWFFGLECCGPIATSVLQAWDGFALGLHRTNTTSSAAVTPSPPPSATPSPRGSVGTSMMAAPMSLSGHPALRPAGAVCYLPRTARPEAVERGLNIALIAIVAWNRSSVSTADASRELHEPSSSGRQPSPFTDAAMTSFSPVSRMPPPMPSWLQDRSAPPSSD